MEKINSHHRKSLRHAATHLSSVRVRFLAVDAVLADVLEAEVHESAIAALVALGLAAVDQVLFAHGDELAGLGEVLSLQ